MKIVITGGHHSSALPVIQELRKKYPEARLYWFGHKFSAQGDRNPTLEFHEITALGISFFHIHAGKFFKTLNIKRLAKIPYGFFQCLYLLIKIKPDVIMSFGGYLAVPVVLAGRLIGIPAVTHEQTVVAGWANRLISKVAKKILISWKESAKYFPKEKTVFVGLPLREAIFEIRSNNFVFSNKLPIVYITTGKIGSHIINYTVGECLAELLKFCNVIHQTGDNSVFMDNKKLEEVWASLNVKSGSYELRKFVLADEIGEAYGKADLVVARSGAHTTAELLALGKRCLLIPIPWVSHNEQFENAKLLVDAGLGKILPEKELTSGRLVEEIKEGLAKHIYDDHDQFRESVNIKSIVKHQNDPAELIVKELMSIIAKSAS